MIQAAGLKKVYIGMLLALLGWGLLSAAWGVRAAFGMEPESITEVLFYGAGAIHYVLRVVALLLAFQGMIEIGNTDEDMENSRQMLAWKLQTVVIFSIGCVIVLLPYTREYLQQHLGSMLIIGIAGTGVLVLWLMFDTYANYLFIKGLAHMLTELGEFKKKTELMIKRGRWLFMIHAAMILELVVGVYAGMHVRWLGYLFLAAEAVLAVIRIAWQVYCAGICVRVVRLLDALST